MGKNLKKLKIRKNFILWYLCQSRSNSETNASHYVKFYVRLVLFSWFFQFRKISGGKYNFALAILHEKISNFKTHFEKAKIGVKMFLWEINLFLYIFPWNQHELVPWKQKIWKCVGFCQTVITPHQNICNSEGARMQPRGRGENIWPCQILSLTCLFQGGGNIIKYNPLSPCKYITLYQ